MTVVKPEHSIIIAISKLPATGKDVDYELDEQICAKIAKRFNIPAVKAISYRMDLTPTHNGVNIEGRIEADLVRDCVVSLEPVQEVISESFDVEFDRTVREDDDPETIIAQMEAGIVAEPLSGDELDIGELMIQQLSLMMDPFPRKQGAKSLCDTYGNAEEASPFAILKGALDRSDEQ